MEDGKMPKSVSYHSYLIESLKDRDEAAAYIKAVLEEGDPELLMHALTDVAEARGGILQLLHQEKLNQLMSEKASAELYSLEALLDALGFQLKITVK
jgi:probable addiction module antidote protein